jgi:hypothetical protein
MYSRTLLVLTTLALASCSSVNQMIREMPPGALTIVVAPAEVSLTGKKTGLHFTDNGTQVQSRLISALKDLDAASVIVKAGEPGSENADFVISPVIKSSSFKHDGWSDGWWASGGLWLVTWIGGLAVEDSSYRGAVDVDCKFKGHTSDAVIEEIMKSTMVNTTFLERNDLFSWPTLQSFILPPFLTSDDDETTSKALTSRSIDAIAMQIAKLLKGSFEDKAFSKGDCRIVIIQPAPGNGARVDSSKMTLEFKVHTKDEKVSKVTMRLNDGAVQELTMDPREIDEGVMKTYVAEVKTTLALRKGTNLVHIKIAGAVAYTRTLRFELR